MSYPFVNKSGNRSLNVMLGDISYFNRQRVHAQYVPLAIGMIAQYAKQEFGNDINLSLFKSIDKFLEKTSENPPDVVGLSVYYWNLSINQYLVNCLREKFGRDVIIIIGGPNIDSDAKEQERYLSNVFPDADAIVVNEGEISFNGIIRKILGNSKTVFNDPIDGAIFLDGNRLVQGRPVGLTLDLSTMGSPYLSGLMDEFMNSDNQPLIQTSRSCPYTCAFCVAGKNRSKLRGFPFEQVTEELRYVSKKYRDKPHHDMYLADENFGIMKRDVEIAEEIKKCSQDIGYPQSVTFYNDKRFTETSREILEILYDQTQKGVVLALQTDNPLALEVSNRRNVSDEKIDSAIAWAKSLDLRISTDLIFGLPLDTRDDFVKMLDRTIVRGFDDTNIKNLMLMDGIEMNRPDFRKKYELKTKYRVCATSYVKHNKTFIAEHEEVVVSSNTFTYEEFLEVRYLNFMFYVVFGMNFQKWFFQFVRQLGIPSSKFFSHFFTPDKSNNWPERYISFLDDLRSAVEGELHDTREEMVATAKRIYEENGNDVGESSRINLNFGGRIIYLEKDWIKPVLLGHLDNITNMNLSSSDRNLASLLIDLADSERVNLKNISDKKEFCINYNVVEWKKNKFKEPLENYKMEEKILDLSIKKGQSLMLSGFQERFTSYNDIDYYCEAVERIRPWEFLVYNLSFNQSSDERS